MSELQKYILGAEPGDGWAMILAFDEQGFTADWQPYNAGIVYKAEDVDSELQRLRNELKQLDTANQEFSVANRVLRTKLEAIYSAAMTCLQRGTYDSATFEWIRDLTRQ